MKIHIQQGDGYAAMGIDITPKDMMISKSRIMVVIFGHTGMDKKLTEEVMTGILLKKPIILARERGTVFPHEYRRQMDIVDEFEFERNNVQDLTRRLKISLSIAIDIIGARKKKSEEEQCSKRKN